RSRWTAGVSTTASASESSRMLSQSGSRTTSKGERATDHLQSRSFASRAFRALAQDDRPPDALKKKTKERREEKHGFSFLFLYPRNGHCHPERRRREGSAVRRPPIPVALRPRPRPAPDPGTGRSSRGTSARGARPVHHRPPERSRCRGAGAGLPARPALAAG